MVKLLVVDLDNNFQKSQNFIKDIKLKLNMESILVPKSEHFTDNAVSYKYGKFTEAAFHLEDFIFSQPDYYLYVSDKPFINVFYIWGDYSSNKIENLLSYQYSFNKNLVVFPNADANNNNTNWIFGNIISMIKWSSSAFRFNENDFDDNSKIYTKNSVGLPIWYSLRINLDVRCIV